MTTGVAVSAGAGTGVEVGPATTPATNVAAVSVLFVLSGSATWPDGSTMADALMTLPCGAVTVTENVNPTDPPAVSGCTLQVTPPPLIEQFGPTTAELVPVGIDTNSVVPPEKVLPLFVTRTL